MNVSSSMIQFGNDGIIVSHEYLLTAGWSVADTVSLFGIVDAAAGAINSSGSA